MVNVQDIAHALIQAEKTKIPITPITSSTDLVSVDEAYQIQLEFVKHKLSTGDRIVGKKIGLTSQAMQELLGVDEPDYGHLFAGMDLSGEEAIDPKAFIQPRIEFEIAFVLKNDITGPGITEKDVIAATDYIVPAIEIIDSRIADWNIRFEDTVADNGSAAAFLLGTRKTRIEEVDPKDIILSVYQNGRLVDGAKGTGVMGNPVSAVAWLANALSRYRISLQAGEVILSGALTKAIDIQVGDTYTARFSIGEVSARFKGGDT